MPGDAISVSKAPIVYVMGEVNKPGGYVLDDSSNSENSSQRLTVMRVIALASGPGQGASLNKSRIIRRTANGMQELPIPLKQIMAGKAPDPPLQAEDIVYVPGRKSYPLLSTVLGASNNRGHLPVVLASRCADDGMNSARKHACGSRRLRVTPPARSFPRLQMPEPKSSTEHTRLTTQGQS